VNALEVLSPGVRSQIQDCGRPSQKSLGIPVGGAFDGYSYRWANHLLGNPVNSPTLEIDVGLARFKALKTVDVATTGSVVEIFVDGQPKQHWSRIRLQKGQVLAIKASKVGLRAYLAINGGFKCPSHLASVSTDSLLGLGGLHKNGQPLQKNDRLAHQAVVEASPVKTLPQWVSSRFGLRYLLSTQSVVTLDVVPCYQNDHFSESVLARFTEHTFTVMPESNRMGIRLTGKSLYADDNSINNIISEGIVPGAVQIMPDGLPIILGVDAQTIGGYPKMGVLPLVSRWALGQLAPQTQVRFKWTSWPQARKQSDAWVRYFGY
jgi:biotin-dependent carboxylase-like uncharacterized protein